MHHTSQVVGGLAISRCASFRIVFYKHLRAMPLALGDKSDVEAGVEKFARSELTQGEDRSIEVEIIATQLCFFAAFG